MLAPSTRDWVELAVVYGVGILVVVFGIGLIAQGGSGKLTGAVLLAHSLLVFPQTRPYIVWIVESVGP